MVTVIVYYWSILIHLACLLASYVLHKDKERTNHYHEMPFQDVILEVWHVSFAAADKLTSCTSLLVLDEICLLVLSMFLL
jgi:hypothetical protein